MTVRNVEPYHGEQELKTETTETSEQEVSKAAESTEKDQVLKTTPTGSGTTNSKDIIQFDSFKMESGPVDETRIDTQKDASKFDEVVEDRQYVEVPVIKGEMKQVTKHEQNSNAKEAVKPTVQEASVAKKHDDSDKLTLPLKLYEDMEIMQAEESRLGKAVSF